MIALREFITSWHLSYLSAGAARGSPEAGGEEQLSPTGDNLANVIQHLHDQHPEWLNEIFKTLRRRVPRIEKVEAEVLADGRLLHRFKDAPFSTPVRSRFTSDGTLKMLAYLTLLHDPTPPKLIGVEEPEISCPHGSFLNSQRNAGRPAEVEAAQSVAAHIEPGRNRSGSFNAFHATVVEALP